MTLPLVGCIGSQDILRDSHEPYDDDMCRPSYHETRIQMLEEISQ